MTSDQRAEVVGLTSSVLAIGLVIVTCLSMSLFELSCNLVAIQQLSFLVGHKGCCYYRTIYYLRVILVVKTMCAEN